MATALTELASLSSSLSENRVWRHDVTPITPVLTEEKKGRLVYIQKPKKVVWNNAKKQRGWLMWARSSSVDNSALRGWPQWISLNLSFYSNSIYKPGTGNDYFSGVTRTVVSRKQYQVLYHEI